MNRNVTRLTDNLSDINEQGLTRPSDSLSVTNDQGYK
jgi:hypothetical protein